MHHVRSPLCGRPSPNPSPTLGILVQEKRRNTTLSTAVDSKKEYLHTGGGRRLRQRITLTTNDTNDAVTQWRLLQSDHRRPPTRRGPGAGRALPARRSRPATGGVLPPLPARERTSPWDRAGFPCDVGTMKEDEAFVSPLDGILLTLLFPFGRPALPRTGRGGSIFGSRVSSSGTGSCTMNRSSSYMPR